MNIETPTSLRNRKQTNSGNPIKQGNADSIHE